MVLGKHRAAGFAGPGDGGRAGSAAGYATTSGNVASSTSSIVLA